LTFYRTYAKILTDKDQIFKTTMSKHEAPNNQPDNQQFNDELAAFDSTFGEYGVVPTNKHEQTDATDPRNHANAIIDRIKAEKNPYSIEDSYNKTLDGVNSVVNENISFDQQFENEMAAFDNILGEHKAQEASNPSLEDLKEATAPRKFTAPSPADSEGTTANTIADEETADAPKAPLAYSEQPSTETEDAEYAEWKKASKNNKIDPDYHLTYAELQELKKYENEISTDPNKFKTLTDEEWDDRYPEYIQKHLEFKGVKQPTKQLASSLRAAFEAVKQAQAEDDNGPRSNKEIAKDLKNVASEAMDSGNDTPPTPTSPEARKKAERLSKKAIAKLRKGGRKSFKEGFMSRVKSERTQDIVEKYTRLDRAAAGAIIRSWNQFGRKKVKDYKQMNSFLSEDPSSKNR
jgi:hypothetical protein